MSKAKKMDREQRNFILDKIHDMKQVGHRSDVFLEEHEEYMKAFKRISKMCKAKIDVTPLLESIAQKAIESNGHHYASFDPRKVYGDETFWKTWEEFVKGITDSRIGLRCQYMGELQVVLESVYTDSLTVEEALGLLRDIARRYKVEAKLKENRC